MNSLLVEREERYKRRKKEKQDIDKTVDLSIAQNLVALSVPGPKMALSDKKIRLLDEGAVVGDGFIDCFIMRGTIEKFLNGENEHLGNIDDEYEGNVNLGHMDFASFPFIIGSWHKSDMHLVDIDNDRKAVDIDLHLDENSIFVKELARQPYDIGVSAEFFYHIDDEATDELSEELGYYVMAIDEILIKAYGLVGECGNVNSDGLELKGGQEMTEVKDLIIEVEGAEELATETIEEVLEESTEEVMEESVETEETTEEVEETETDEEEVSEQEDTEETEEVEEEIVDEVQEDEEDEDEEDEGAEELSALFDELKTANETLVEENKALKAQNRKLQKRLATKNKEIGEFTEKFKGLSVSLGLKTETKEEVTPQKAISDGIGD